MGCVIEHLQGDHWVTVIQDFTDARGARHQAGETAILRLMELEWKRQEIVFEWEREGARETLYFLLDAKDGPRNGRMRDYFSLGERVLPPKDAPAARTRNSNAAPVPELVEAPITDVECYGEAVERVWALAARRRFEEAEAQIQLIVTHPDPFDGRLQSLAEDVVAIAIVHAADADSAVCDWARRKAVGLWYAWGSGATSGGEGTVRRPLIRAAEERLARCRGAALMGSADRNVGAGLPRDTRNRRSSQFTLFDTLSAVEAAPPLTQSYDRSLGVILSWGKPARTV